jgi:hypothetical protein
MRITATHGEGEIIETFTVMAGVDSKRGEERRTRLEELAYFKKKQTRWISRTLVTITVMASVDPEQEWLDVRNCSGELACYTKELTFAI